MHPFNVALREAAIKRGRKFAAMRDRGVPSAEIAAKFKISRQRVDQLVRNARNGK